MLTAVRIADGRHRSALAAFDVPAQARLPFLLDEGVIIESHRVSVEIDNQVATTRIEQVFYNDSARIAEGTYVFPLPAGAAVSGPGHVGGRQAD